VSADGGNATYRIALPEFEGPLDLLLHLCKTHEIEIVNIPMTGRFSRCPPIEPWNVASPKAKMPPSVATSQ